MRLSEIDKATFHRKLADPAEQFLHDLVAELEKEMPTHQFEVNTTEDNGTIRFTFDRYDNELVQLDDKTVQGKTLWIINRIKEAVHFSDFWVWDTWKADAGIKCYLIRK